MAQNNIEWINYIRTYGDNFDQWPIALSQQDKEQILMTIDVIENRELDQMLSQFIFPDAPQSLRASTLNAIKKTPQDAINDKAVLVIFKKPAILMMCVILSLGLGIFSGEGVQSNNTANQSGYEYSYYSYGADYSFGFYGRGQ